jgi:hypothetical protein
LERFNHPGAQKFELLSKDDGEETTAEERQAAHGRDTLEAMSVAELRALAEEEEIDLGNVRKKNEIIAIIAGD